MALKNEEEKKRIKNGFSVGLLKYWKTKTTKILIKICYKRFYLQYLKRKNILKNNFIKKIMIKISI